MDTSTTADWEASNLFSPSKAREQQAQAKDWAAVDAWLSRKYANTKRLPPFERTDETLQALLTLATLNDAPHEHRFIIERVEKASLQAHSRRAATAHQEPLHHVLIEHLDDAGRDAIDALAETAIRLGAPTTLAVAERICDLTVDRFDLEEQLKRAEAQSAALESEKSRLSALLSELRSEDFRADPALPEQTADLVRNTKQLRAKIGEYDDRLNGLKAESGTQVRIEDFTGQIPELEAQRQTLAGLKAELRAYEDLPSDAKEARKVLQKAKVGQLERRTKV